MWIARTWLVVVFVAFVLLAATSNCARADAEAARPTGDASVPYVSINVGIEFDAIERAANDVAKSLDQLSVSVAKLASSPSLSPETKAQLVAVLGRVDTLSSRVADAITRLPAALEESRKPITGIATGLASHVRVTVALTLALVVVVLLCALAAVYVFILRPVRGLVSDTASRMATLVDSLKATAEIVSHTTTTQLELKKLASTDVEPPSERPSDSRSGQ